MKHKFDKILKKYGFVRVFPNECICWEKQLKNDRLLAIENTKSINNKDKYHVSIEKGELIINRFTFNIKTKKQLKQLLKII